MQNLIAQIVNRIPTLTPEQIVAMNAARLPTVEVIEANDVAGEETLAVMAQFGPEVNPGVYSVARTAILGIMAKGKVPDETSALLIRAWTDIVEPLDEGTAEEALAISDAQDDESFGHNSEDLIAEPTGEAPAVEPAAGSADIPVDTVPPVSGEVPAQTAEKVDTPLDQP